MTGRTQRIPRKSKHGCDSENKKQKQRQKQKLLSENVLRKFSSFIEFYFISGFILTICGLLFHLFVCSFCSFCRVGDVVKSCRLKECKRTITRVEVRSVNVYVCTLYTQPNVLAICMYVYVSACYCICIRFRCMCIHLHWSICKVYVLCTRLPNLLSASMLDPFSTCFGCECNDLVFRCLEGDGADIQESSIIYNVLCVNCQPYNVYALNSSDTFIKPNRMF